MLFVVLQWRAACLLGLTADLHFFILSPCFWITFRKSIFDTGDKFWFSCGKNFDSFENYYSFLPTSSRRNLYIHIAYFLHFARGVAACVNRGCVRRIDRHEWKQTELEYIQKSDPYPKHNHSFYGNTPTPDMFSPLKTWLFGRGHAHPLDWL